MGVAGLTGRQSSVVPLCVTSVLHHQLLILNQRVDFELTFAAARSSLGFRAHIFQSVRASLEGIDDLVAVDVLANANNHDGPKSG